MINDEIFLEWGSVCFHQLFLRMRFLFPLVIRTNSKFFLSHVMFWIHLHIN